jgi:membrane-associated phospholipid phosphatase
MVISRVPVVVRFGITWAVMAVSVLGVVLLSDKLALHASINAHHSAAADLLLGAMTHLADGLVPTAIAVLILLFGTRRSFLMIALSCGLGAILVQGLKHVVFDDVNRPFTFKEALGEMHWVEGIDLHAFNSFPSGHATAAFSMCLALAVIYDRRWATVPLALLAGLLAFTRVYLSQHFTEDILAGSTLGCVVALLVHRWLYISRFSQRPWLDRTGLFRQNQNRAPIAPSRSK